jgi:hypothetical protein
MTETPLDPSDSGPKERRSFTQRLLDVAPSDLLRLAFLSILVGFLLAVFGIDPARLWVDFFGTMTEVWGRFLDFLTHGAADILKYFLLGAVIVIPIWVLVRVLRASRRD